MNYQSHNFGQPLARSDKPGINRASARKFNPVAGTVAAVRFFFKLCNQQLN
jgi:hypothetical protein